MNKNNLTFMTYDNPIPNEKEKYLEDTDINDYIPKGNSQSLKYIDSSKLQVNVKGDDLVNQALERYKAEYINQVNKRKNK